jgi:hypothetical protein
MLAADPALHVSLGSHARQYAEANFKISRIAATVEEVPSRACASGRYAECHNPVMHTEA